MIDLLHLFFSNTNFLHMHPLPCNVCVVIVSELLEKVMGEDQRAFPLLLEKANEMLDTVSGPVHSH